MNRRLSSSHWLALVLLVSLTTSGRGDDPKPADPLQGTWVPTAAEMAGQSFPEEIRKSIKLVIKDDQYEVTVGKTTDKGTVKLDRKAKPNTIDITGTEGPNKGKTILAIFEHEGDKLKVCYDLSGKARPQGFETKPGTPLFLVTYEKEKR